MNPVIINYDDVIIDRASAIDVQNYYGASPGGINQKLALGCIRYAIEDILQWKGQNAVQKFDENMIHFLKLEKILSFIEFPIEISKGNPNYILHLLYPDLIRLDTRHIVERVYEKVLNGKMKRFPREYFSGGLGFQRFCICIEYLLKLYCPVADLEQIYCFFTSAEGKHFLYKKKLKIPADQFAGNMLDAAHFITKNHPDSDLYYNYYSFMKTISESVI